MWQGILHSCATASRFDDAQYFSSCTNFMVAIKLTVALGWAGLGWAGLGWVVGLLGFRFPWREVLGAFVSSLFPVHSAP